MRKVALLIGLVFVSVLLMPFAGAYEFQAYGRITKVVDGDTVWFHSYYGYRAGETFKIRFADINAPPEIYTEEGKESKAALEWLLDNYGYYVFLDVDDVYETDHYGRVVAVLYLPFWNYGYASTSTSGSSRTATRASGIITTSSTPTPGLSGSRSDAFLSRHLFNFHRKHIPLNRGGEHKHSYQTVTLFMGGKGWMLTGR